MRVNPVSIIGKTGYAVPPPPTPTHTDVYSHFFPSLLLMDSLSVCAVSVSFFCLKLVSLNCLSHPVPRASSGSSLFVSLQVVFVFNGRVALPGTCNVHLTCGLFARSFPASLKDVYM